MDVNNRIGDYEILEELGRGGMGRVYRVRNVISDRVEAMKVLLPDLVSRADLESRFLREIKTLAALEHPNIATLRTAMKDGDQLVMIMEFVDGESLSQRLKRGPLPVAEALTYVDHVLDALSYAHARHVIHRDIKPANMMLSSDGLVKLTDFGIARSRNDVTLTAAGTTTGSLPYMSPEQVNAEPTDARSDLYSVGISLYEMVTGQRPFQADSDFAVMVAHLKEVPRPPMELAPALGPELNAVIMKAIEKSPADRYQSADDFRNALLSVPAFAASLTTAAGVAAPLPPLPTSSQAETVVSKARTPTVTPVTPERVRTLMGSPTPSSAPPIPTLPQPVMRKPANAVLYMAVGGVLTIGSLAGIAYYFNSRPSASAATTSAPAPAPSTPAATPAPRRRSNCAGNGCARDDAGCDSADDACGSGGDRCCHGGEHNAREPGRNSHSGANFTRACESGRPSDDCSGCDVTCAIGAGRYGTARDDTAKRDPSAIRRIECQTGRARADAGAVTRERRGSERAGKSSSA